MVLFSIYSDLFVKCGNAKTKIMCTNTDNAVGLSANISFLLISHFDSYSKTTKIEPYSLNSFSDWLGR